MYATFPKMQMGCFIIIMFVVAIVETTAIFQIAVFLPNPDETAGLVSSTQSLFDVARIAVLDVNSNPDFNIKLNLSLYYYSSSIAWSSVISVCNMLKDGSFAGILGPITSTVALTSGEMTGMLNLPMVSSAATNDVLQNPYMYPSFFRTCPNDALEAEAIVTLISNFGWKRVGIVYSADNQYGLSGYHDLVNSLSKKAIDIVAAIPVTTDAIASGKPLDSAIGVFSTVRIVILWLGADDVESVLKAAKQLGMMGQGYVWICSETTLDVLNIVNSNFTGLIAANFEMPSVENVVKLVYRWQNLFPNTAPKTFNSPSSMIFYQYDAVLAFAYALNATIASNPSFSSFRLTSDCISSGPWQWGQSLIDSLKKTNFAGITGQVRISQQSRLGDFTFFNLIKNGQNIEWSNIATLHLNSNSSTNAFIPFPSLPPFQWLGGSNAQPSDRPTLTGRTMRIITKSGEPFVIVDSTKTGNDRFSGFTVAVVAQLATVLGFNIEWVLANSSVPMDTIVKSVSQHQYDMAASFITINSQRSAIVTFAPPYYTAGLGLMTVMTQGQFNMFQFMNPFAAEVWQTILGVLVFLSASIYTFERGINADVHPGIPGIFQSIYWSMLALVSGVQDEIKAKTRAGRILTWATKTLILLLVSTYTANLASVLTASQIDQISGWADITSGKVPANKICAPGGGATQSYLQNTLNLQGAMYVTAAADCINYLRSGVVSIFIYDRPILEYYAAAEYCDLKVIGDESRRTGYGMAFPSDSLDADLFIGPLLDLQTTGWLEATYADTVNKDRKCAIPTSTNQMTLNQLGGMFALFACLCVIAIIVHILDDFKFRKGQRNEVETLRRVKKYKDLEKVKKDFHALDEEQKQKILSHGKSASPALNRFRNAAFAVQQTQQHKPETDGKTKFGNIVLTALAEAKSKQQQNDTSLLEAQASPPVLPPPQELNPTPPPKFAARLLAAAKKKEREEWVESSNIC